MTGLWAAHLVGLGKNSWQEYPAASYYQPVSLLPITWVCLALRTLRSFKEFKERGSELSLRNRSETKSQLHRCRQGCRVWRTSRSLLPRLQFEECDLPLLALSTLWSSLAPTLLPRVSPCSSQAASMIFLRAPRPLWYLCSFRAQPPPPNFVRVALHRWTIQGLKLAEPW